MKFIVSTVGKIPGRLGYFVQSENGKQFHTPLLIQCTKGGSIPYLAKEVFDYVTKDEHILHINVATTDHMVDALNVYKKGISSFVGFEHYPSFLSVKDSCEVAISGFHEKDNLPLFTRKGKIQLTSQKYMNLVENFKPDMYHTLCDSDTNFNSPKKRIIKSVERSEKFFKECLEKHKSSEVLRKIFLFAPIVGGYSKEARTKCIKSLSHSDIDGYMIDGLHNYGVEALKINEDAVKEIVLHCIQEIDTSNHNKPRMMLGAFNPLVIIELIAIGIDIFDTSYVYLNSFNYKALTFSFNLTENVENRKFTTDLNDDKFKDDFSPLVKNCECLACKKHTKAYVYHLIKTRELLGPILLMIHNTHHYLKYFEIIRHHIEHGELLKLINHIKKHKRDEPEEITEKSEENCNSNEVDQLNNEEHKKMKKFINKP